MSIIKNAKEFFGLAPLDPEMDSEAAYYAEESTYGAHGSAAYQPAYRAPREVADDYDTYREDRSYAAGAGRYGEPEAGYSPAAPRTGSSYAPRVVAVRLTSYTRAASVGEPFRDGDAVVFDMNDMEFSEAKRVIDFASGLCFALRGEMKKLDSRVFALVPAGAAVSTVDLEDAARRA
ncbi:cell division protein SepF [Corynebacterium uberis]|uniref:cell division protein SepF n=1 Tax=Corynebacterium TaxID=1716 RepID=UPI001D09CD20|nr:MULTISPECIES: cell division protein SepF [Corynebacterium]MCZ9308314.1 cell division protein SepF [Corynebacterium sp. c6VSa_13]UDL73988.1 cell division protein SepF [Corynebacterium uberis]UDL75128.1 cell division protein SepF [Corynebacterium uberis]UDL77341.1 cell division protein SepF [Corynebacterium uberis]UDL81758.1 cell division protein SepF [Corynebacterium uberis]